MVTTAIKERGEPFWKKRISLSLIIDIFIFLYVVSVYILSYGELNFKAGLSVKIPDKV